MVSRRVNIGFCAFLKSESTFFQGMDDLAARLGRNEEVVREVCRDEKDGAKGAKSAGIEQFRRKGSMNTYIFAMANGVVSSRTR